MDDPVALKFLDGPNPKIHRVRINAAMAKSLRSNPRLAGPAIVVAREVSVLPAQNAGLLDSSSLLAVVDGDWSEAILVVLPADGIPTGEGREGKRGDVAFLASVQTSAPNLLELAERTVAALRAAGIEGELVQDSSGRWVNRPINTLTLKAQPRAGNIAFTIYGNPDAFDAGDFLRKDQNSYSRGWIEDRQDVDEFVGLAKLSQARRIG